MESQTQPWTCLLQGQHCVRTNKACFAGNYYFHRPHPFVSGRYGDLVVHEGPWAEEKRKHIRC